MSLSAAHYAVIEQQLNHSSTDQFHAELQRAIRYAASHDWASGAACPTLQLQEHGFFFCGSCCAEVPHMDSIAHLASDEHVSCIVSTLQQPGSQAPSVISIATDALLLLQQYYG